MINFRYHLVSITAVIVALTVGIVLGVASVQNGLVDQLRNQLNGIKADVRNTDAIDAGQRKQLGDWEAFAKAAGPALVADKLRNVPVLIVAVQGINTDPVSGLAATLKRAARYEGTVWLTSKFALDKPSDVKDLADMLGLPQTAPASGLRLRAYTELTGAWTTPPATTSTTVPGAGPGTTTPTGGTATTQPSPGTSALPGTSAAPSTSLGPKQCGPERLLSCLGAKGFVTTDGPDPSTPLAVADGTRFVVASGDGAKVPDDVGAISMVTALLGTGPSTLVVAVESVPGAVTNGSSKDPLARARFLAPLLATSSDAASRISTDDAIDDFKGQVGTVLALGALASGEVGHYGVGPTADSVVPAVGS